MRKQVPQITEFRQVPVGQEFRADGYLYVKVQLGGMGGPLVGAVPSHIARDHCEHPDEQWRQEGDNPRAYIYRSFSDHTKVIAKRPKPLGVTEIEELHSLLADLRDRAQEAQLVAGDFWDGAKYAHNSKAGNNLEDIADQLYRVGEQVDELLSKSITTQGEIEGS